MSRESYVKFVLEGKTLIFETYVHMYGRDNV